MDSNPLKSMASRVGLRAIALAALVCAVTLGGGRASAQTVPIDPIYLTVSGENVILRCCPWSFGYPVGYLSRGQVLLADGRTDIAFRVQYPDSVPALVDVEDVTYDADRGVATLIKESRLNAYNVSKNSPESWKSLLNRGLDVGVELTVLEEVKNASGVVTGFLVIAPSEARGYVDQQFVRQATEQEIVAFRRGPLPVEEAPVQTADAADAPTDEPVQTTADATDRDTDERAATEIADAQTNDSIPAATASASAETPTLAANEGLRDPAPSMTQEAEPEPLETIAATMEADDQEVAARDAAPAEAEREEVVINRPIPTREQLDESFDALLEVDILEAEIRPLIGEHRRLHEATPDTEENVALRNYLLARIELLLIRADLQRDMRELAQIENSAELDAEEMQLRIAALNRRPDYVVVGRLLTSTLYDGRRLPRMYRLESIEATAGRTIAYVMPSEEVDLDGALGMIVGVIGERQLDSNLRLSVIRPTRVDRLTLGE